MSQSLHIMELLSVKCLHVDDIFLYCHLLCTVVLVGVVLKVSLGGTTFDGCIVSIQVVIFSKVTI